MKDFYILLKKEGKKTIMSFGADQKELTKRAIIWTEEKEGRTAEILTFNEKTSEWEKKTSIF